MERERSIPRTRPAGGGPEEPAGEGLEATLAQQILTEADRILDSIHPISAELYLQQNRQRGGE